MNAVTQALINPLRLRILQQITLTPDVTAGQLMQALPDIPQASLYRHLRLLEKGGLVEITSRRRVRGAIEKRYGPARWSVGQGSKEEGRKAVLGLLLSLMINYETYFDREDIDPVKDTVGARTCALWMSDEEFADFAGGLGALISRALANPPSQQRRLRQLALLFVPPGEADPRDRKDEETC